MFWPWLIWLLRDFLILLGCLNAWTHSSQNCALQGSFQVNPRGWRRTHYKIYKRISNQKMDANTLEIACHTCISLQVWGGLFPLEPLNPHMPHELRLTRAFRHTLLWGLTSCEIHGSNQLINAKSQGSDFQHQSTIVHSHDMQLSDCLIVQVFFCKSLEHVGLQSAKQLDLNVVPP